MERLASLTANSRAPAGWCFAHLKGSSYSVYDGLSGYGALRDPLVGLSGLVDEINESGFGGFARGFADYLAQNPSRMSAYGLTRLPTGTNPFDAPRGSIVVLAPGSPGLSHPTAGDITIANGGGLFYNDGVMRYGRGRALPDKNPGRTFFDKYPHKVLGIYVLS